MWLLKIKLLYRKRHHEHIYKELSGNKYLKYITEYDSLNCKEHFQITNKRINSLTEKRAKNFIRQFSEVIEIIYQWGYVQPHW